MSNQIAEVFVSYNYRTKEYSAWLTLPSGPRPLQGFSTVGSLMQVVSELVADEVHTRPTLKDMTPVEEP